MADPKQPATKGKTPAPPPPPPLLADASGVSSAQEPETAPRAREELEMQIARLTEVAARAQADLQNFKMRMERDAADLRTFVQSGVLLKLLPILDDMLRAIDHAPSREGLEQIVRKLEKVLSDAGAEKIEAVGKHVDPLRHETVNSGPGEKDVIIAVHEEGYELNGRILRPAKVQVGNGTKSV